MKETKKNFFYSNFDLKLEPQCIKEDNLSIEKISNLTTQNSIIEPLCGYSNLLINLLGNDKYYLALTNCPGIVKTLIYIYIYEYFDKNSFRDVKKILGVTSDFSLYVFDENLNIFVSENIKFSSMPNIFVFRNKLYATDNKDNFIVFVDDFYPLSVTSCPNFDKTAYVKYRVYFTIKENPFYVYCVNRQYELETTSITNLETYESLYPELKLGQIVELLKFKNEFYVVQTYGISKLIYTASLYQLNENCAINSKILPNTVHIIDDYIAFMTSDGFYIYDGNDIKKLFVDQTKLLSDNHKKAVIFNNKYYLLTSLKHDNSNNLKVVEFDIEQNTCNIYDAGEIDDIFVLKSSDHYSLNIVKKSNNENKIFMFDNKVLSTKNNYIKFNKLSFSNCYLKSISNLKISAKGKFKTTISSNLSKYSTEIVDGCDIKNLGLIGNDFQIELFSDNPFWVESIYLSVLCSEE